ncbi:MAG: RluA family pseudouridine synthase [Clostridia bacterium]|nr:RluA family pseudouridine synthase [Clostridia bacterium]
MPTHRIVILPEMEGRSIRSIALGCIGMSSSQFKRAKFEGSITLDGVRATADVRVRAGQQLCLSVPEKEAFRPRAIEAPLTIAYEDDCFWVIDKPAPMPSVCGSAQDVVTLENALYAYLGQPQTFLYRPVNRLDKGTSGLMIVAKNAHIQYLLQKQLHTDGFVREYLAVIDGRLAQQEGLIDLPIAKADGATVRREVRQGGREARTYYRVLQQGSRSLVRLRLDTGRTHQIRVHMAHMGCPVTGDFLYGNELPEELPGRFALHSALIRLRHPFTHEWLTVESPLPAALLALLAKNTSDR